MPGDVGFGELMFLVGVAVVGFGAVKFMLMASADKKRERERRDAADEPPPSGA